MNLTELVVAICIFLVGVCFGTMVVTPRDPEPVKVSFSLEGAGMCKVAGGGKTWLLVDMTNEFLDSEKIKEVGK